VGTQSRQRVYLQKIGYSRCADPEVQSGKVTASQSLKCPEAGTLYPLQYLFLKTSRALIVN
jgi:hypothetical protein